MGVVRADTVVVVDPIKSYNHHQQQQHTPTQALLYKKAPATRKKAYADLLLARERELKGAASEIHEAGFASIFALLEGHDQTCSICLCTIQDPTVTRCCHVFCKVCGWVGG